MGQKRKIETSIELIAAANNSLNRTTSASHSVLLLAGRLRKHLSPGTGFSAIIISVPGKRARKQAFVVAAVAGELQR
jgi:hypothetical protein